MTNHEDYFIQSLNGLFLGWFQNAYAESFRGHDYLIEQLDNNTYKKTVGLDPFVYNNETKKFVPYIHRDGTTFTVHGTVTLDSDCTFNFYQSSEINENSTALFQDKILVKAADVSSPETWERLNLVNNASCNKSWGATFEQFSTGKLRTDVGMMEYKYIINDGTWKTQLEATNLSNEDTKMFGFDQIVDLNVDTIQFGNNEINIDNFNGTIFDRDWLERNDARIMIFEGFYFDVDLAWDYLNSVQVIDTGTDSSRIIFDYRTDSVLLPNDTLILDPTFGDITFSEFQVIATAQTGSDCGSGSVINSANSEVKKPDSGVNDSCRLSVPEFSIDNLPDNADVTQIDLDFTVATATNGIACSYYPIDNQPTTSSASVMWTDGLDGIPYVDNNVDCSTTGAKSITLGSSANSDLETAISNSQTWFSTSIAFFDQTRDGLTHTLDLDSITLTITYNLPPDPPKQFSGDVLPANGVSTSWLAGETNGDTHNDFTVQRLNLDGVTWDDLATTASLSYLDNQPQQNDIAKYRIWDNGNLGRGCSQFLMNSTVIANLTSHYPFCYTTNDSGIQDNDGTVTGNELYDNSTGIVSFDFDGNSYVTVPNETDYDFDHTDAFSISFWVNFPANANGRLIQKDDSFTASTVGWGIRSISGGSSPVIQFAFEDGTSSFLVQSSPLGLNTFRHVVATYDGSSNQDGLKVYIDGILDNTGASSAISSTILNNRPVVFGAESDGGSPWTGRLYDIMIIDRELDSNEVAQLYHERIDTSTLAMNPNAVTDLTAVATSFSSVDLDFTLPFTFGGCDFLQVNYTTPKGDPLTVLTDTGVCANSYEVTGVPVGSETSFRVSTVNDFGKNGSGNIANATILSEFTIGDINVPSEENTDIQDVLFDRTDVNSTTVQIDVRYPNGVTDFRCNVFYEYANISRNYSGLAATAYDSNYDQSSFIFHNADDEVITFDCEDFDNSTINGQYTKPQDSFPFRDQIDDFRSGTFDMSSDFGGMDLVTLIIVIVSMVGFNRTNPAVGVITSVMVLGATSYLGIITLPTVMFSAMVLAVILAVVVTRKE